MISNQLKHVRRIRNLKLGLWSVFSSAELAFLYVPVVVLIVFSFNDNSIMRLPLEGFTFRWYIAAFNNEDILVALKNSAIVAGSTTILTLFLGTAAAISIDRLSFPGKGIFNRVIMLPIALPGIITGISLLSFFRSMDMNLTLATVVIGHSVALMSVVVTQVLARLQRFNRRLEEASADLGARPLDTFFSVTLPNIRTSIIGSSLLVFTLSFDEIPITFFLTGRDNTLPMYMYSVMRRGITPELNAVGSVIIAISLVLLLTSIYFLSRGSKRS
jgi:spermidine/putrescine transport system permease protein